ncbi:hypothetical protein JCM10207_000010 [Rhodosporidiobolus poonsookiae]
MSTCLAPYSPSLLRSAGPPSGRCPFSSLPLELFLQIAAHLSPVDLFALSVVNRRLFFVLRDKDLTQSVWRSAWGEEDCMTMDAVGTSEVEAAFLLGGLHCQQTHSIPPEVLDFCRSTGYSPALASARFDPLSGAVQRSPHAVFPLHGRTQYFFLPELRLHAQALKEVQDRATAERLERYFEARRKEMGRERKWLCRLERLARAGGQ